MASTSCQRPHPACTVRLKPVRADLSPNHVMEEVRSIFMKSRPFGASASFEEVPNSGVHAVDLYFQTAEEANSSKHFLDTRQFLGQIVRWSVLDVSDGCKIRLSPIGPSRSKDDVMQEAQKRLFRAFQPRDASSAFRDPWKPDGFVADLYYETPQKAKSALVFLQNRTFFDQVVAARVVGARPRLQGAPQQGIHGSGSPPSRAPVVNSAVVIVVEPVRACPIDQLQPEVRRALKALDVQHASENLCLEHGLKECEDASRFHRHLSPCVYLYFKDRNTAISAAELLSRAGVLQNRQVRGLLKEDLDRKGSPNDYISHCSNSGRNLRACDEAAYTQSGVLLHRWNLI